jgi:UDP-2-acetamido-2-deoxy-ribo-hexuluronate aminotransferase
MEPIPLLKLQSSYQSQVYNSGRWIDGACMKELEDKLKDYLGVKYVVLTNSGTSSLLAAYWVLKQEFSSITTCPYTWPATYQAARVLNMETRFKRFVLQSKVELSPVSLNVISHLYGQPNQLLSQIEGKPFIEDTLQSFGAEYRGQKLGTLGKMGCFSFHPNNPLHTNGHGGALCTNDESYYKALKVFVRSGQSAENLSDHVTLNLGMDELRAEFLIMELAQYDQRMNIQREIVKDYLSVIPFEQPFLQEEEGDRHIYSVCNLLIEKRDEFRTFMQEKKIETAVSYGEEVLPADQRRLYSDITSSIVSLPCRWNLTGDEVRRIRGALREWFS